MRADFRLRFVRCVQAARRGQKQTAGEQAGFMRTSEVGRGNDVSILSTMTRRHPNATPQAQALVRAQDEDGGGSASASSPVGAITVTLDSVVGERPVAGSKMWLDEKSSQNLVS
jgi:hypothetical protein